MRTLACQGAVSFAQKWGHCVWHFTYEDTALFKKALLGQGSRFLYESSDQWEYREMRALALDRTGSQAKGQQWSLLSRLQGSSVEGPPSGADDVRMPRHPVPAAGCLSDHLHTGSALPRTCTRDADFISSTKNKSKTISLTCIVPMTEEILM